MLLAVTLLSARSARKVTAVRAVLVGRGVVVTVGVRVGV